MPSTLSRLIGGALFCAAILLALSVVGCSDEGGDEFVFATLTWEFEDACDDGNGLQIRMFDEDSSDVWPSDGGVFLVDPGQQEFFNTICERGNLICYGARTSPDSGIFWGVDIDGLETCVDCCWECDDTLTGLIELACDKALKVPATKR